MEERGREKRREERKEEEKEGSLHPLEFSKVGAYGCA